MKATEELMERIKEAIETVDYGSVCIRLAEAGSYVEIIIERKIRIEKR